MTQLIFSKTSIGYTASYESDGGFVQFEVEVPDISKITINQKTNANFYHEVDQKVDTVYNELLTNLNIPCTYLVIVESDLAPKGWVSEQE